MAALFRTILVPHDGSEHATRALRVAAEIAQRFDSRIIALRAVAPFLSFAESGLPDATPWIPPEDIVGNELQALERIAAKALPQDRTPVECRVVVGDPYACIMDAAPEADLIVMATHGRTGLEHLVIGSVAEKVVRHAPIPVLTIRREEPSAKRSRPARAKARGRTGA
jgi:universal stress protein A